MSEDVAEEAILGIQDFTEDELSADSSFALSQGNESADDIETLLDQNNVIRTRGARRRKRKKKSSTQPYDFSLTYLDDSEPLQSASAESEQKNPDDGTSCAIASELQESYWQKNLPELLVIPVQPPSGPIEMPAGDPDLEGVNETANLVIEMESLNIDTNKYESANETASLTSEMENGHIDADNLGHEASPRLHNQQVMALQPSGQMESCHIATKNCESANKTANLVSAGTPVNNLGHDNQRVTALPRNVTHPPRMIWRRKNREAAQLPMLASKDEFVRRLRVEKVLVVTAETGSGKTTQLPQYCAEEFPGLVICTQPRVIAAISVARRIAKEFDNGEVGRNVGYEARSGNKKRGSQIMIMTDAALIRMAQHDRLLKKVGVLMIDEAHERSLNTDIVVGIAKTVLEHRPEDFRVVIASATIDPKPFLDFFFDGSAAPPPLTVPGRVFPVTTETRAFGKSDNFSNALANEVVKTLKKRILGHCLVFLQGARDVDDALACFERQAQPNWKALPLYGALSPEEQNKVLTFDDKQGALRMVVFCTNVAETSLTVPDVRLVIDTGLAKESRYDPERRMTILEEVYISRSSAEQRKGRAGRTAEGHCVRLFAPDTLERDSIEPEILRSSLDLVMLQVCSLGFDPLDFNFITRPDEALMRSSLAMLSQMGCLTPSFQLTERGRVFNNLPFDPRLSNFVLKTHEEFGQGPAAAVIAAIVSAPGSVIYFGSSKDDRRKPDSVGFSSDLMLLRSIYETWLQAGEVDCRSGNCNTCRKAVSRSALLNNGGCRTCRVKHTKDNSLNNKVLEFVRGTVTQVQKEIDKLNTTSSPDLLDLGESETERVVGVCLAVSFPEQVCEFVMPSDPTAGVYAVASDLKGQLSYSSVLRVARSGAKYFVAMSQTKLPKGLVLMDKAHGVSLEWLPDDARQRVEAQALNTMECYKRENVSGRYCSCCRKLFDRVLQGGEQYARFVVCQYDSTTAALSVFAPEANTADVAALCHASIEEAVEEDLAQEVVVDAFNGFATIAVAAGFNVKKITLVEEQPCRVHFTDPPAKSRNELMKWVCEIAGCKASDVKWCSYLAGREDDERDGSSAVGIVVFRQEDFAKKAQSCGAIARASEHGSYRALVTSMDENVKELLRPYDVHPVKVMRIKPLRCQVQFRNVPGAMDERQLRKLLRRHGLPDPSFVKMPISTALRRNAIVTFNVKIANDDIISKCQRIPEMTCVGKHWPSESIVLFQKCREADDLYRLARQTTEFEVDGTAVHIVANADQFLLEDHLASIGQLHGVKHKIGRQLKKGREVIFSGTLTSKCNAAAQELRKIVEPIQYFFGTRDKTLMGEELRASGKLQLWAVEYGLMVEERFSREKFSGIFVYGEKYQQGQFMAELAEYYSEFMTRYHLVGLSPAANYLFRKGNQGEAELKKVIDARRSGEVEISYQGFLSSIEIVVKPGTRRRPSDIIAECVSAINGVLSKFNQRSAAAQNCVYCDVRPGRKFSICGHSFCRECLQQDVAAELTGFSIGKYLTAREARAMEKKLQRLMGCCPSCNTRIAARDLSFNLTRATMEKACMAFAQLVMRREDHPMGVCPMPKCGAFMPKKLGYSACPCCMQLVCPKCGVGNDSRHGGNTCEEYQQLLKKGTGIALLRSIISNAKEFAEAHWRTDPTLSQPCQIDVNPGLERGCMALRRYCFGIERVGLNELEKSSVFAWHGTANTAIPAICEDGFDPGKRRTQAYGIGEYFGITASVSMGFVKDCQRLIVAQIIKCSAVKEVQNFCYVVDNPTDWTYSFNLPVLVVTYGSSEQPPIPWLWRERRLLPYPFLDQPDPEETFARGDTGGVCRVNYIRVMPDSLTFNRSHSNQGSFSLGRPSTMTTPAFTSLGYPSNSLTLYSSSSNQESSSSHATCGEETFAYPSPATRTLTSYPSSSNQSGLTLPATNTVPVSPSLSYQTKTPTRYPSYLEEMRASSRAKRLELEEAASKSPFSATKTLTLSSSNQHSLRLRTTNTTSPPVSSSTRAPTQYAEEAVSTPSPLATETPTRYPSYLEEMRASSRAKRLELEEAAPKSPFSATKTLTHSISRSDQHSLRLRTTNTTSPPDSSSTRAPTRYAAEAVSTPSPLATETPTRYPLYLEEMRASSRAKRLELEEAAPKSPFSATKTLTHSLSSSGQHSLRLRSTNTTSSSGSSTRAPTQYAEKAVSTPSPLVTETPTRYPSHFDSSRYRTSGTCGGEASSVFSYQESFLHNTNEYAAYSNQGSFSSHTTRTTPVSPSAAYPTNPQSPSPSSFNQARSETQPKKPEKKKCIIL